jgi:hypothetical protein
MSTQATPVAAAPVDALPNATCLIQAARIAIQQDKPIQLDYFTETGNGAAYIGEDGTTKERVLFKSKDAFTSFIQKLYKVPATQAADSPYDYIILTENSLYIVSGKIQKRKVNLASLKMDA